MTSPLSTLRARDAAAAQAQQAINQLTKVSEIREAIYAAIDAELGQYPQYKDHARTWALGFITAPTRTKRGIAFRTGDVVLYTTRDERMGDVTDGFVSAYSVRNGVDTSIPVNTIEPLATTTYLRHPAGLVSFEVAA